MLTIIALIIGTGLMIWFLIVANLDYQHDRDAMTGEERKADDRETSREMGIW